MLSAGDDQVLTGGSFVDPKTRLVISHSSQAQAPRTRKSNYGEVEEMFIHIMGIQMQSEDSLGCLRLVVLYQQPMMRKEKRRSRTNVEVLRI